MFQGVDAIEPDNPTVVVLGDTQGKSPFEPWQERNEAIRDAIFEEIARRRPAFVMHVGDLVALGGSEAHWRQLDEAAAPLVAAGVPLLPVLGNHDYMGDRGQLERHFAARFPRGAARRWFDVVHRGLAWVALDSNFRALGPARVAAQRAWLAERLAAHEADEGVRAIAVCCHHPPMTNSWVVASNRRVREWYAKPFEATGKGRAFFTGHCHAYEHFVSGGRHYFVTGGGGGPRQRLHRYWPFRRWHDHFDGASKRFLHFCEVEVGGAELVVRVVRAERDGGFSRADETTIRLAHAMGTAGAR